MSRTKLFSDHLKAAGAVRGELHGRDTILNFGDPAAEHRAAREGAAVADVSDRTQIELTGDDRATFLHNLCTNDIRKLSPGHGCEAFLLDAQGRILAYLFVLAEADSLIVEASPGHTEAILSQLDRYLIREKVELTDASQRWGELLVLGPKVAELLSGLGATMPADEPLANCETTIADHPVRVRRVGLTSAEGVLLAVEHDGLVDVWNALGEAGAVPVGATTVEMARIEAGSPLYGLDIHERSLPQEVARDDRAISFAKGCYIGQETVARIDARGHVNKFLVGVRFEGTEVPAAGTPLSDSSGEVGSVTTATFSRHLNAPLALAYVKRGFEAEGHVLESPLGKAKIIKLPV